MAGKPKTRPLALSPQARQLLRSVARQSVPLPRDPGLLQNVVRALLLRFTRKDKKEYQRVAFILRYLTVMETGWVQHGTRLTLQEAFTEPIKWLSQPQHPRWPPHFPPTLKEQRTILLQDLRTNGYSDILHIPHEHWFQRYASALLKNLRDVPCLCTYNLSPKALAQSTDGEPLSECDDGRKNYTGLSMRRAVHHVLARLHHTTPNQIETLLKPHPYLARRSVRRKRS